MRTNLIALFVVSFRSCFRRHSAASCHTMMRHWPIPYTRRSPQRQIRWRSPQHHQIPMASGHSISTSNLDPRKVPACFQVSKHVNWPLFIALYIYICMSPIIASQMLAQLTSSINLDPPRQNNNQNLLTFNIHFNQQLYKICMQPNATIGK